MSRLQGLELARFSWFGRNGDTTDQARNITGTCGLVDAGELTVCERRSSINDALKFTATSLEDVKFMGRQ
jgi:hypothetical protein